MNKNILYVVFAVVILMSFFFVYKGELLFIASAGISLVGFLLISKNTKIGGALIFLSAIVSLIFLVFPSSDESLEYVENEEQNQVANQDPEVDVKPVEIESQPSADNNDQETLSGDASFNEDEEQMFSQDGVSTPIDSSDYENDYKTQEELIREARHKEKSNYKPTAVENAEQYIPSGWASSLMNGTTSAPATSAP